MMIRRLVPIIAAVSLGFAVAVTWLLTPSSSVTAPPNQPAHSTLKEGRIAGLGIVEPRGECVAVGSAVPGIVIEFGTNIEQGLNFFGWPINFDVGVDDVGRLCYDVREFHFHFLLNLRHCSDRNYNRKLEYLLGVFTNHPDPSSA